MLISADGTMSDFIRGNYEDYHNHFLGDRRCAYKPVS